MGNNSKVKPVMEPELQILHNIGKIQKVLFLDSLTGEHWSQR